MRSRIALADAPEERGALDELVERQREEAALRGLPQHVARAADALEERRDRARGADLDRQIDVADVDAELERRRRDERPELAGLQPLLGVEAARPREAAVVARDRVLAEQPRELRRDPLGHLARVDEDERRPVLADELRHPRVDLLPLLVRADGGERRGRHLDAEVELAERPGVHERALALRADEEPATSSSGFCVAERPMRWTGWPASASSRSSESARWLPRLSRASAWISSTMTVETVRSIPRPPSLVSSM